MLINVVGLHQAVPGAKMDLILLALRGKKIGFDKASAPAVRTFTSIA